MNILRIFSESEEEAYAFKSFRRAQMPAVYNEKRPLQQPIPRCEFVPRLNNENIQSNEINSSVNETEFDTSGDSFTVSLAVLGHLQMMKVRSQVLNRSWHWLT